MLAALAICGAEAGELVLQLPMEEMQWGQAINARLIAVDAEESLADIDLAPLEENFAVFALEESEAVAANTQVLKLELHPRGVGSLTIAPLTLGTLRSRETTVNISNITIHNAPLLVDLNVSELQVYQRQQVLITVEIKSPERFFNVETDDFRVDGFEARGFVMDREPIDNDAHYRSRIVLGWAVFPLLSGKHIIEIPSIQYMQGGKSLRRFYLPRTVVQVRDLPPYIPPNMPVAKVRVDSVVHSSGLMRSGHLAYWNISLSADGTLAYWLPPVLRNLQSTADVEYLPAKSRPELRVNAAGTHSSVVHEVPFKPLRIGNVNLPILKFEYFDPHSARIETVYHRMQAPFAWNGYLLVLFVLLILMVIVRSGRWLLYRYQQYSQKQLAFSLIREANSPQSLIQGLRQLAYAEGWSSNLTLSEFLERWQRRYGLSPQLQAALVSLSAIVYGGQQTFTLQRLKIDMLTHLKARHKRRVDRLQGRWEMRNILLPQVGNERTRIL